MCIYRKHNGELYDWTVRSLGGNNAHDWKKMDGLWQGIFSLFLHLGVVQKCCSSVVVDVRFSTRTAGCRRKGWILKGNSHNSGLLRPFMVHIWGFQRLEGARREEWETCL